MLNNENSVTTTSGNTAAELDNLVVPLGLDMITYVQDTKCYKLGDGVRKVSQLPKYIDTVTLKDLQDRVNKVPLKAPEIKNKEKLLKVDEFVGTVYKVSEEKESEFLTKTDSIVKFHNKSSNAHRHQLKYFTKEEVEQMGLLENKVITANREDSDILSWLVTGNMEREEHNKFDIFSGYADEFNEEDGIGDKKGFALIKKPSDSYYESLIDTKEPCSIESTTTVADRPVSHARVYVRYQEELRGVKDGVWGDTTEDVEASDYSLQMSRDGGTTWVPVNMTTSPLTNSSTKVVVGSTDFSAYTKRIGERTIESKVIDNSYATAKLLPIEKRTVRLSRVPGKGDMKIAKVFSDINGFPLSRLKIGYCFANPNNPNDYILMCSGLNKDNEFYYSDDSNPDVLNGNPVIVYPGPPNSRNTISPYTKHTFVTHTLENVVKQRTIPKYGMKRIMKAIPETKLITKTVKVDKTIDKTIIDPCKTVEEGRAGIMKSFNTIEVYENTEVVTPGTDNTQGYQAVITIKTVYDPEFVIHSK